MVINQILVVVLSVLNTGSSLAGTNTESDNVMVINQVLVVALPALILNLMML